MLVVALYSAVCVAQQNLHAFHAAKVFLIIFFDAQLADVVAGLVVVVLLNVGFRHLAHVAQHMGGKGILVLPDASFLDVESGKAEELLLENAEILVGELAHEQLLCEPGVARILVAVLDVVHPLDEKLLGNAQGVAEIHGVETPLFLVHHHHNVVGRLVVDKQLAVAVVDDATRGILHLLEKGVAVGTLPVVVAHHLEREQPDDVDGHNRDSYTTDDKASFFEIIVFHFL